MYQKVRVNDLLVYSYMPLSHLQKSYAVAKIIVPRSRPDRAKVGQKVLLG